MGLSADQWYMRFSIKLRPPSKYNELLGPQGRHLTSQLAGGIGRTRFTKTGPVFRQELGPDLSPPRWNFGTQGQARRAPPLGRGGGGPTAGMQGTWVEQKDLGQGIAAGILVLLEREVHLP